MTLTAHARLTQMKDDIAKWKAAISSSAVSDDSDLESQDTDDSDISTDDHIITGDVVAELRPSLN
jgi:hypothetical protein